MTQNKEFNVLELKDINWTQKGKQILKDVSWTVEKDQHWVLLGLNGSGKTSILKAITGYMWPNKGEVSVLGHKFGQTNIHELRKSIGWVSTSLDERFHNRPSDTALQIVLSGKNATVGVYDELTDNDFSRAKELLKQLNIDHLSGQLYFTLSQGEKRKAMIARALMASPSLLILDEPCNGLDIYSKEELLSTIQSMNKDPDGPTLIYVTHHIEEVVPSITHAILLHQGVVTASGKKHEVITEPKLEETFQVPLSLQWENERPWIRVKSKSLIEK
ncbi:ABC transporter ATP-binding protein [Alteribacillus sp. HJP-4]|uniref:ABC transporter ATP-binding protein n=1 Tax=Alteribacillus sp. HJP-4 TaxID=2775394 RepID=UPI0035CD2513